MKADYVTLVATVCLATIACVAVFYGDTEVPKLIAVGIIGYVSRLYVGVSR